MLTKSTVTTSNIQALSDTPNQTEGITAAGLKLKFDQYGIDNEDYINDVLTVEIEGQFATKDELADAVISGLSPDSITDAYLKQTGDNLLPNSEAHFNNDTRHLTTSNQANIDSANSFSRIYAYKNLGGTI